MQLRPEEQRVVHREHEDAGVSEEDEIAPPRRQQAHAANRDRKEHDDRDDKAKRDKGNRRQIAQADLDREPGRTPDHAERDEGGDDGQFSRDRHRVAAHQVFRVATAFTASSRVPRMRDRGIP